jgi:hypothetical protein
MKLFDIAPWPYFVAAVPTVACMVYRGWRLGFSALWQGIPQLASVFSGVMAVTVIGNVAFVGHVPYELGPKDRIILIIAALAFLVVVATHGLRRTPLGDRLRLLLNRFWWGPRHIVEAHPLAFSLIELSNSIELLHSNKVKDLSDIRENLCETLSRLRTVVPRLNLSNHLAAAIIAASDQCWQVVSSGRADNTAFCEECRAALRTLKGTISGTIEPVPNLQSADGAVAPTEAAQPRASIPPPKT